MVASSFYTVANRAFLGNVVGPDALAGITVCMPISFVMLAFGMLIGLGSSALISIRLGQQDAAGAEQILGNALGLAIGTAALLTPLVLLALEPLLLLFGASNATLPYAKQLMQILLLGSVFQYVGLGLNAAMRAEGNPRWAMLAMLLLAALNILLDAVLILGFGLGIRGAAVATVVAQAITAAFTLLHFRSGRSVLRLRIRGLRPRWSIIRPALGIGSAPFAMHVAAAFVNLLLNRALVAHGGDAAVGAYGIIGALAMLLMMPVFGLTQGAQPIIGYNFGAGRFDRVRRTLRLAVIAATAIVCIGFVLAESFPGALVRAFTDDPRLAAVGAPGMRIVFAALPVVGFQVVAASFFQAIGQGRTALVLSLLRQVILLIPLIIILPPRFGLGGAWAAGPIADAAASLLSGVALLYELRRLRAHGTAPI